MYIASLFLFQYRVTNRIDYQTNTFILENSLAKRLQRKDLDFLRGRDILHFQLKLFVCTFDDGEETVYSKMNPLADLFGLSLGEDLEPIHWKLLFPALSTLRVKVYLMSYALTAEPGKDASKCATRDSQLSLRLEMIGLETDLTAESVDVEVFLESCRRKGEKLEGVRPEDCDLEAFEEPNCYCEAQFAGTLKRRLDPNEPEGLSPGTISQIFRSTTMALGN